MTKRILKATLKNGNVVERITDHNYVAVGYYYNIETGETIGATFSENAKVKEVRHYVYEPITPNIARGMGIDYIKRAQARNAEAAKVWRWEIAKVD